MSDIDDVRAATNKKLIELIGEIRGEALDNGYNNEHTLDGANVGDVLRFVFSRAGLSDEKLACFVVVCVGAWTQKTGVVVLK